MATTSNDSLLLTETPPAPVPCTDSAYVPILAKVKVSVVPLALKTGAVAPLGTVEFDHLNVGCVAKTFPNWSKPCAIKDWLTADTCRLVVEFNTVPPEVLTLMLVKVGVTVRF